MDIVLPIIIVLVILPLILEGIGLLLQFFLGGGMSLFILFRTIWDKEQSLTFKEGSIVGLIAILLIAAFDTLSYLLISYLLGGDSTTFIEIFNQIFGYMAIFVILVSFVRLKFKFGVGFFVSYTIAGIILAFIMWKILF